MSLIYLEVKSMAGSWIDDVAKELVELSRRIGIDAITTFNGVRLRACHDSNCENIVAKFHASFACTAKGEKED